MTTNTSQAPGWRMVTVVVMVVTLYLVITTEGVSLGDETDLTSLAAAGPTLLHSRRRSGRPLG